MGKKNIVWNQYLRDKRRFADVLSRYFADYPMRLVCLNEKSDYVEFRTEVRKVFRLINLRKNRKLMQKEFETNPDYKDVDIETVETIAVMLDAPEILEHRNEYMKNEEREGNDMCQAIREMLEDARTEGRTEGRTEVKLDGIRKLIKNMKMTVEEALNVLEISENEREYYLQMIEGVEQ